MRSIPRLFLLSACTLLSARAVELRIQYNALERMLAETVFTQDGRRYVRGDQKNKCNFAYLEKPKVRGKDGKLVIRARFSGRSSVNAFGVCVGLGDAFDAVITAMPAFRDNNIVLTAVSAASDGKTGIYIRRVCAAMSASLGRDFRYPISQQFQKALEDTSILPAYPRQIRNFDVPQIRVGDDELVLALDFIITVR